MKKSTNTDTRSHLNNRKRVQVHFQNPSLTKQYFKDECDINNIVNKFQETGNIPLQNNMDPQYGDAPDLDLKTALDLVHNLNAEFNDLNLDIQEKFGHDPKKYAQFLSNYEISPESFDSGLNQNSDTSVSKPPAEPTEAPESAKD